jgi:hypothetical protein
MNNTPSRTRRFAVAILLGTLLLCARNASAQAFRIDNFDPRLTPLPLRPTSLPISQQKLQSETRKQLVRIMMAEEAFAMRGLPLGHHGLVLRANGNVTPDGTDYQHAIQQYGLSVKASARVRVTDVRIESDKVVLDLNGGPDKKHKWLQHISVGGAGGERQLSPDEPDAVGSRVTLLFPHYVPEMTGQELKAFLAPLLDFSLKGPLQAYTDTLPPLLRDAIKAHKVLVGMDREMVLYALTQPDRKVHEDGTDGLTYEEWIYGRPPQDVQFVRFAGDRVVRVEIAAIGKDPVIRDTDETNGYLASKAPPVHTIQEGDAAVSKEGEVTRAAPSLRRPGENVPDGQPQKVQLPASQPGPPGSQFTAAVQRVAQSGSDAR